MFPSDGPYVPDGLTPEEYAQIKQKEADDAAKMNYGAWGPRFRRSSAPDGDWFVNPRLWVNGFSASDQSISAGKEGDSRIRKMGRWLRYYLPPFLLAWFWTDMALALVLDLRNRQMTTMRAFRMVFTIEFQAKLKVILTKSIFSAMLTSPCAMYLEWASRRRLWTRRRTFFSSLGVPIAVLLLWSLRVTVIALT